MFRTRAEHLDALNAELAKHQYYTPDMRFIASPEGVDPSKASGYEWRCDPPESLEKVAAFVQTAQRVNGSVVLVF